MGRRNIVKKPTFVNIFLSLPLRLLVLVAIIGIAGTASTSAAPLSIPPPGYWNFSYRFVAGSSFHSADYTMRDDYQSGACISVKDTAGDFLTFGLHLPDGVRIDYLRVYYYDTDGTHNGTANLRKYDGSGGTTTIATVSSSGSGGYGSNLSAYSGHVVDNYTGGYVLNWTPSVVGSTMRLCGMRIAYRLPAMDEFLPLIFK
jgi:hypothetical protein